MEIAGTQDRTELLDHYLRLQFRKAQKHVLAMLNYH